MHSCIRRYSLRPGTILWCSVTWFNLYTLSGTVGYVLDIFGSNRRTVEDLQAQADVQSFTVLGVYLALSSNVVNTFVAAAAYCAQIEATEQIVLAEKEQIKITEAQVQAGTVPYVKILSIKTPPLKQPFPFFSKSSVKPGISWRALPAGRLRNGNLLDWTWPNSGSPDSCPLHCRPNWFGNVLTYSPQRRSCTVPALR